MIVKSSSVPSVVIKIQHYLTIDALMSVIIPFRPLGIVRCNQSGLAENLLNFSFTRPLGNGVQRHWVRLMQSEESGTEQGQDGDTYEYDSFLNHFLSERYA